jgi:hypothetical protein
MKRSMLVRALALALAFVHTFPARGHIAAFLVRPTLADAGKGFGALAAVILYLLPASWQARGLGVLWRRRRWLRAVAWSLAVVHMVPLLDHLPRYLDSGDWADAWRGFGACIAVLWFVAPPSQQATVLSTAAALGGALQTKGRLFGSLWRELSPLYGRRPMRCVPERGKR